MPRRLNSESFFYLNVRSRSNHKARTQIPASNPMTLAPNASRRVTTAVTTRVACLLAALVTMSSSIGEAAAQTQPQTAAGTSNVAPTPPVSAAPTPSPARGTAAQPTAAAQSAGAAGATSPTAQPNANTVEPPPSSQPAAITPPAPTPEQQAAATNALTAGQQAFAKGEYQVAEQQYRTAFDAVPSARAQHGIASSLDLQAKPTDAFEAYSKLLARPDLDQLPPADVTHARERAEVLGRIPAVLRLVVVSNEQLVSGAKVLLDGVEQTASELRLEAGAHRLQVLATGYQDFEQTLNVKPAQVLDLPIELSPVPAPAVEPPPASEAVDASAATPVAPEPASKIPAYVTLGVAGGAAIAGTVFGIKALGAEDRFGKSPTVAHADDVERNALIADMAFGVAFTLGITGIVLLLTDEPTEPGASPAAQSALQVVPYVARDRGGAVARMTF